jgi:uncharacterized membrane protein
MSELMLRTVEALGQVARSHGDWMTWNLWLAFIPLVLAVVLFRRGVTRTASWWFGLVVFVLFLPNAPYVLSDVIHLFDDIRMAPSDLQVLGLYLPLYLTFFALGFGAYVAALDLARRYLRHEAPSVHWLPIEGALHLACAIGIYLGRVLRLNSWEVFTRPHAVLAAIDDVSGVFAITVILLTFGVLFAGSLLTRAVIRGVIELSRRGGWEPNLRAKRP